MNTQPVAIGGVIQVLLIAIFGVVNAWYPLTETQTNSVLALISAISIGVTWWVNSRTTSTAKPEDAGIPLVQAGTGQPGPTAEAAGRFVALEPVDTALVATRGAEAVAKPVWNK